MAVNEFTLTRETEEEIDDETNNRGQPGYSERYYSMKRQTPDGKWQIDVVEYYG